MKTVRAVEKGLEVCHADCRCGRHSPTQQLSGVMTWAVRMVMRSKVIWGVQRGLEYAQQAQKQTSTAQVEAPETQDDRDGTFKTRTHSPLKKGNGLHSLKEDEAAEHR